MQLAQKIYFKNSLISFVNLIGNPSRWAGVEIPSVKTRFISLLTLSCCPAHAVLPKWLFTWQLGLGSLSWKWSERLFSSCSSWHFKFFALAKVKFGRQLELTGLSVQSWEERVHWSNKYLLGFSLGLCTVWDDLCEFKCQWRHWPCKSCHQCPIIKGVRAAAQHHGRVEVRGAELMAWWAGGQAVLRSLGCGTCRARSCLSVTEFIHLLVITS